MSRWIDVNPRDAGTLPPPFEPLEVETVPGALFSTCPNYVLCSGIRNGIKSVEVFYAHDKSKKLSLHAIKRWRIRAIGSRA